MVLLVLIGSAWSNLAAYKQMSSNIKIMLLTNCSLPNHMYKEFTMKKEPDNPSSMY